MAKSCTCSLCFNKAVYISQNTHLNLCEECFMSMEDEYECSMEDEIGMPFDEYYDFVEVDD